MQVRFHGGICNDRQKDANGKSVVTKQIYDPCAGSVNVQGACREPRPLQCSFASNIIPAGRINPISAKLLNLWPAPNTIPNVSTNNFTTVASTGGDQNQLGLARETTTSKPGRGFSPFQLLGAYWTCQSIRWEAGLCADRCSENYHSTAMAAGYTHTFTPTVIFGFNVSRQPFQAIDRRPKNCPDST